MTGLVRQLVVLFPNRSISIGRLPAGCHCDSVPRFRPRGGGRRAVRRRRRTTLTSVFSGFGSNNIPRRRPIRDFNPTTGSLPRSKLGLGRVLTSIRIGVVYRTLRTRGNIITHTTSVLKVHEAALMRGVHGCGLGGSSVHWPCGSGWLAHRTFP